MDEEEVLVINQVLQDLLEAEEDALAPARQINMAINPFETLTDQQFVKMFRVSKILAQEIINTVRPFIVQGQSYSAIDLQTKVYMIYLYRYIFFRNIDICN